ncbi:MAG: ATP-binding protein [Candidatus Roizmanbacteria bacterium]|nr:ATP-binding protein [Candidatus Roizmanbacteria bacterium]
MISLLGSRQSGKTTFLKHLQEELIKKNKKIAYITFENKQSLELFNNPEEFIAFYKDYDMLIIDEFHYAKEGGQKLKFLYDTTDKKYFISGSSSLELTFQTGKYMVGRMVTFKLSPFSFTEFLLATNKPLYNVYALNKPLSHVVGQSLMKNLELYLIYGGYPAVVLTKSNTEKEKILEGIIENYLLRDIKDLLTLITEDELILLAKLLATQIGNLINYNELSTLSKLPYKQLLKHLEILKKTYIVDLIRPYSTNKRTELVKNPKVYFFDSGFRNYVLGDFRPFDKRQDIGALIENYIFTALSYHQTMASKINFWRTKSGAEVDFIIEKQGSIIPIEVKYSSSPVIGKSLYSFFDKYKPNKAYMITKDIEKEIVIEGVKILFIPAYRFSLYKEDMYFHST